MEHLMLTLPEEIALNVIQQLEATQSFELTDIQQAVIDNATALLERQNQRS